MKNKRVPIRTRMLRMMLIPAISAIATATLISLVCMIRMASQSERALSTQLERNLEDLVSSKAEVADAKFAHYSAYIDFICDYITGMYPNRDFLISIGHDLDYPRATTGRNVYAMTTLVRTDEYDLSDPAIRDENRFLSNLENILEPIVKKNDGLITTSYIGTETGVLPAYDKYSYLAPVAEGEKLIYDYFESEWYQKGRQTDDLFLTGLYIDSQGRGLTITIGKAFHDASGKFAGVCAADFDITGLYDEIIAMDIGEGAYSFTIDEKGEVISPEGSGTSAEEVTGLSEDQIETILSEKGGIINANDQIFAYSTIETTGWKLCVCVPKTMILNSVKDTRDSINIAILVFVIAAILII
ncbi:MAG: cache domain-containing protein, partial [Lachnospiraceae bacterium]|nr:cache domain-containing protein [Lachnospiraceae bacterium]